MTQIESKARELIAQLSAVQKYRLALEILQDQEPVDEFSIPDAVIEESTKRLDRYLQNPETGKDAISFVAELKAKYETK